MEREREKKRGAIAKKRESQRENMRKRERE